MLSIKIYKNTTSLYIVPSSLNYSLFIYEQNSRAIQHGSLTRVDSFLLKFRIWIRASLGGAIGSRGNRDLTRLRTLPIRKKYIELADRQFTQMLRNRDFARLFTLLCWRNNIELADKRLTQMRRNRDFARLVTLLTVGGMTLSLLIDDLINCLETRTLQDCLRYSTGENRLRLLIDDVSIW